MKYVAFLRGINVGGRIIKMADLKACIEDLGFKNVRTIQAAGNVLFESNVSDVGKIREKVEDGVSEKFGYIAKILVYSADSLAPIIAAYPYDSTDETWQHYVIFFDHGLEKQLAAEATDLDPQIDLVTAGDGVLYWRVPKGMTLDSCFSKYLTKAKYKDFHTNRNLKTVKKMIEK